jgi:hypothetical protein
LEPPRIAKTTAIAAPKPQFRAPHRELGRIWRGVLAVMVLGALAAGLAISRRSAQMEGRSPLTRVAVLPFAAHGGDRSGQLSGAIVTLLSSALDGVGELRTVDPSAVLAAAGERAGQTLDQGQARGIAMRLGAGRYISGDVVEGADGRVTISASAHDAASGRVQGAASHRRGQ